MMRVPRKPVLFAVLIVLVLAACGGPPAVPTEEAARSPSPGSAPEPTPAVPAEVSWDDRSVFKAGLIAAEQGVLDELPGASEYHIDLLIPEDLETLEGREEVRYTNREEVALPEVYFRLFANANGGQTTVSGVTVDGHEVETAYEFERSALRVPLPVSLEPGDRATIAMDFQVEIPREMGGNYGLFGYFDDVLVLDEFYPVVAVYDDEGWNVEDPPPAGDLTYFDASFYLVQVTAPADLVSKWKPKRRGRSSS
jgi:hypothetical protein